MKVVTVWERWSDTKNLFEHNHVEDGHSDKNTPTPYTNNQIRLWDKATWCKRFAYKDGITIFRGE